VYECSVVATKLLKEKYDYVGDVQMLIGDKSRDVSGKIVSHTIRSASQSKPNPDLVNLIVVLDDICDGGATFIGLKELLKSSSTEDSIFVLYTTHGIYSKGVTPLTDVYDVVLTTNYLSKSNVPISVEYLYYNHTHIFKKYSEGV
jgi:ribose-phosphate pyrophosphokinase